MTPPSIAYRLLAINRKEETYMINPYAAIALPVVAVVLVVYLKRRHNCLPWRHNWRHFPTAKFCTNKGCDAYKVKRGWL